MQYEIQDTMTVDSEFVFRGSLWGVAIRVYQQRQHQCQYQQHQQQPQQIWVVKSR